MHIIFFNTKGGVSKSTLCEFSSKELQRLGYSVHIDNTDQQKHVTLIEHESADYFLYDTAGSFTTANVDLLKAASEVEALIIIPIRTGNNDFEEVDFLLSQLEMYGVKDKAKFVFTQTRPNSKSLANKRNILLKNGFDSAKWVMPSLDDFSEWRDTSRTRNEISAFLHEVIL